MNVSDTIFAAALIFLVTVMPVHAGVNDAILPPPLPWHGASERLIADADDPWRTPAEASNFATTPDYDQTIAYVQRLARSSPLIRLVTYGHTPQGRPMVAVIVSSISNLKNTKLDAGVLHAGGRHVLFAQAGIHAGEIDGKDAGLMLIRDIAHGAARSLVDQVSFVFVPMYNADGHEQARAFNRPNQRGPDNQGWRTNARNLNLNRDYAKLDAVESRAQLALIQLVMPDLSFDLHVTDGIDYQYDITYGFNGRDGGYARSPSIARWLNLVLKPGLDHALGAEGHLPGPLIFAIDENKPDQGLVASITGPKFSDGFGDLVHRPSVLVENHSLKPYRQRVLGTYVLLAESMRVLARDGQSLKDAMSSDRNLRPDPIAVGFSLDKSPIRKIDFAGIAYDMVKSPVSGRPEVRWLGQPVTIPDLPVYAEVPVQEIARARAYWVPPTRPDIIERLTLHGIRFEVLKSDRSQRLAHARLSTARLADHTFEGHVMLSDYSVAYEIKTSVWPAGSIRVATDQPLGDLAIVLLDAQSREGFLTWGFFPEILQRTEYVEGYALAPLGEQMLAHDPDLARMFSEKLNSDPAFAMDPEARLTWIYAHSPYADPNYLLYPIGREP